MAAVNRVLIAGDTHGNLSHMRYLVKQAREYRADAVFVLGDFGFWEHTPDGIDFLDRADAFAQAWQVPIYFLDGNHDNVGLLLDRYPVADDGWVHVRANVHYSPRGHRFRWGATSFITLGGAYSVDKDVRLEGEQEKRLKIINQNSYRRPERRRSEDTTGTLWFPDEEMTDEEMAKILADRQPVDVILAHDKPSVSTPSRNFKNLQECLHNQRRLTVAVHTLKPLLFLHGHLHHRYTDFAELEPGTDCRIEGLCCDPGGFPGYTYRATDSWLLLDVRDGPHLVELGGEE